MNIFLNNECLTIEWLAKMVRSLGWVISVVSGKVIVGFNIVQFEIYIAGNTVVMNANRHGNEVRTEACNVDDPDLINVVARFIRKWNGHNW